MIVGIMGLNSSRQKKEQPEGCPLAKFQSLSKNILTDVTFFSVKFISVMLIPAGTASDGIEEAAEADVKVCFVLGEVALNTGEEDEERVISSEVLAGNVHAHCFTEHFVEVAEVLGVDYLKGYFWLGFLMDDFDWSHGLDITDFKGEVIEVYFH